LPVDESDLTAAGMATGNQGHAPPVTGSREPTLGGVATMPSTEGDFEPSGGGPSRTAEAVPVPPGTTWWLRVAERVRPWLRAIVAAWCVGVLAFSLRLLLSWYTVRRLQTVGASAVDHTIEQAMLRMKQRLGLRRGARALQSTVVNAPVVVRCFRSVILLPASLITGMPASQLEAILAHELAHIRRYDYLANLVQTLIETFFFYHPAVWWLSQRIRVERENCCDDLVVAALGDRVEYGRALLAIEEYRGAASALALGARSGSLLARVRRLLQNEPNDPPGPAGSVVGLGVLSVSIVGMILWAVTSADEPTNLENVSVPVPHQADNPPTENEARAAFEKAGIHVQIQQSGPWIGLDGRFFGGDDDQLDLSFSGSKVTDRWMRYLLAFPKTTSLRFSESTRITDETLRIIGQLPNLRSLRLASSGVTGSGLRHLANCSKLQRLTITSSNLSDAELAQLDSLAELDLVTLSIGGRQSSDQGLIHVGKLESLEALELDVGQADDGTPLVTGQTLRALAPLTKLTWLKIRGRSVRQQAALRDDDLAVLAGLPKLDTLSVSSRSLTDAALRHIGRCGELKSLSIWHAPITDNGLLHLAGLTKLEDLHLYGTRITGTGTRFLYPALADSATSPGVKRLSLLGTSATDAGLAEIAKLSQLGWLRLGTYGWFDKDADGPLAVTDKGMVHLTGMKHLTSLDLSMLGVTDAGIGRLRECPQLMGLGLAKLSISDKALADLGRFTKLTSLELRDCSALTRAGIESLHQVKPDIRITVSIDGRQVGTLHGEQTRWTPERKRAAKSDAKPDRAEPSNRVLDVQGRPITGAKLEFSRKGRLPWQDPPKLLATAVTDNHGRFTYPKQLPDSDTFYVYVTADGFLERSWRANQEVFRKVEGVRQPDTLVLYRPVTVSGQIIGADGQPFADADIAVDYFFENGPANINGNRVKSDAGGKFTATGVPPANIFVRYETPYKSNEELMPTGTQPRTLCVVHRKAADGERIENVVLDLRKCNCVVEGTIVDHEEKGVAGRWIRATFAAAKGRLDESIMVKSDEQGRFRFAGLSPDEYVIGTATPGFTQRIKAIQNLTVQVRLTTYVTGRKSPQDEAVRCVWGEPNAKGLVAGLQLSPDKKAHALGDVLRVAFVVRNPTREVQVFSHCFSKQGELNVFDEQGNSIAALNYGHFTGIPCTVHYRLDPDHEAAVGTFQIGLTAQDDQQNTPPPVHFQVPCRAGQTLTLQGNLSAAVFGRGSSGASDPTGAAFASGRRRIRIAE